MNTRNIGEINHTVNEVYAIVKLLAAKAMDEEKEKNIVDGKELISYFGIHKGKCLHSHHNFHPKQTENKLLKTKLIRSNVER